MLDQQASTNFFNHVMELWINPEIEKRVKAGKLPENFVLTSAQVIMYSDGRSNVVRLNKEVKAFLVAVAKRALKVNEEFPLEDGIKEIKNIKLTERDDPNAGHVTFLRFNNEWHIVFDFRYNKKKAKDTTNAANEFLKSAKMNYEQDLWRSFVDNMYSATELLAVAQLLPHADKDYSKRQWHEGTQKRYTSFVDTGNFKIEYKTTLLELRRLRKSARYLSNKFTFTRDEAEKYLKILEDMLDYTDKRIN